MLLLQPGRTDSSSGRFVPGNVQFRPFSAVTTNCYPNVSWQLGSDCCLGSSATRRESRNRTVLYVLQLSTKAELDMTSQELVLPSKEWFDFVKFWCHSSLSPDSAGPGHDLNRPSGLKRKGVSKAAAEPAAEPRLVLLPRPQPGAEEGRLKGSTCLPFWGELLAKDKIAGRDALGNGYSSFLHLRS